MDIKPYPQEQLAAQAIGYWSRETAHHVITGLRTALAEEHLTQPHWWILNHVAGAPGAWTRTALTAKLTRFDDQNTDFEAVYDDLTTRGWLTTTHDTHTLALTVEGEAGRLRAHDRNAAVHARIRQGIDDPAYATTIDTLRHMVANLGGNADLP
ncbi:MarR family transcriptional regulator [Streptomyces sp. NPDC058279]|uniref:MarR family transcriptional regulator n=1 Tax=Streptomyces sp. NPDC058279 TaxID=3346418 RepID=UPI0036EF5038